jgi:hypothetical protein
MITAFGFGLTVALATGLVGDYAWRRLPAALGGLAALLGAAVAITAVSLGTHLHLRLGGYAVAALVFGLITGGQLAHAITDRTQRADRVDR